jgi:Na+/proline symporter
VSQQLRPNRAQVVLAVLAALSYAIGYPVAIVAHAWLGWVLVTAGGVFLVVLLSVTMRRMTPRD